MNHFEVFKERQLNGQYKCDKRGISSYLMIAEETFVAIITTMGEFFNLGLNLRLLL